MITMTPQQKRKIAVAASLLIAQVGVNIAITKLAKKTPLRSVTTSIANILFTALLELYSENIKTNSVDPIADLAEMSDMAGMAKSE